MYYCITDIKINCNTTYLSTVLTSMYISTRICTRLVLVVCNNYCTYTSSLSESKHISTVNKTI